MKITEITKGKGKLYCVALEDDSKLWLHSDLLQNEFLHIGDDLSQERIADLKQRAAEHRAYEYGLYLLEDMARTAGFTELTWFEKHQMRKVKL